jgi:hypothetical protein
MYSMFAKLLMPMFYTITVLSRWERMSQPKQSREPKVKNRSEAKEKTGESVNESQSSLTAAQPDIKVDESSSVPSSSSRKPSISTAAKPAPRTKNVPVTKMSTTISLPDDVSSSTDIAPRQAQSSVGFANDDDGADDQHPKNVRSSLALLKAKTVRGRRRGLLLNAKDDDSSPRYEQEEEANPPSRRSNEHSGCDYSADNHMKSTKPAPYRNEQDGSRYEERHSSHQEQLSNTRSEQSYHLDTRLNAEYDEYSDQNGHDDDDDAGEWGDDGMEVNGIDDSMREPCPDCGRRFLPPSLAKHVKICKKVFLKKRKVFDSAKMRIEAIPDLKSMMQVKKKGGARGANMNKPASCSAAEANKSNWKVQSEAFRAAMRSMKDYNASSSSGQAGGSMHAAPAPAPYVDPSFVQCPHCRRKFNSKAADRHIPLCKSIIAKPSKLKKGAGQMASTTALATPSASMIISTPKTPAKRGWN